MKLNSEMFVAKVDQDPPDPGDQQWELEIQQRSGLRGLETSGIACLQKSVSV